MHAFLLVLVAASAAQASASEGKQAEAALVLSGAIALPGVDGRIDHLAVDLARRRLFVAALGNGSLEVVDLDAGKVAASVPDLGEPQGVLYVERGDRVVVACGEDDGCAVFDASSARRAAFVEVGIDADNLRWDAPNGRIHVAFDEALGVIDAESWKLLGKVELAAHPEGFQLDPARHRAFVNVPGARQVAVVDLAERRVASTWTIDEAGSNFPLALVPAAGGDEPELVLLGCRSPAKLVVRAASDGTPRQTLDLSGDVDDLFYEPRSRRVFAICGAGSVDVFERGADGVLRALARVPTAAGARTGLLVPELGELFVAAPARGTEPARILRFRLAGS